MCTISWPPAILPGFGGCLTKFPPLHVAKDSFVRIFNLLRTLQD
ncbi:unnamed protein product [Victoria cruziana]